MNAGDVLLFHRPTTWANVRRNPFGTLMTALIHITTRSRWNHCALHIGDGLMVEATNRGVVVSKVTDSTDEVTAAMVDYGGNDLEDAMAWAAGRVGWSYGYLNAFLCGARNIFPALPAIKFSRNIICSELVAEALERAAFDWPTDTAHVSPGDIAERLGVSR